MKRALFTLATLALAATGSALAAEKGFLVSSIVIPRPHAQVIEGLM